LAQFYKELKELRISQKISLEEISGRTKIHIQYLQAIENGDFKNIEMPYLRLFLRAYSEEIGGNSQRSLEQLDSFMGTVHTNFKRNSISEDTLEDRLPLKIKNLLSFITADQKKRQDYTKGAFFSVIFIFAIIISQKIFKEDSNAVLTDTGPLIQEKSIPITKKDLIQNYILDQSSEELLNIKPPFFIKIKALKQIVYTFRIDSTKAKSRILNANMEEDLESFIFGAELIFNSTELFSFYINGTEIKNVANYNYPMRLVIKPDPPSIFIQRYKPLP